MIINLSVFFISLYRIKILKAFLLHDKKIPVAVIIAVH